MELMMSQLSESLHPDGPMLSRLSAGMWRLGEWGYSTNKLAGWVQACIDLGVTTFDHADIYGNYSCESLFGKILKNDPRLRHHMQIVTKCGICLVSDKMPDNRLTHYNTSADHIIASAEKSLSNLNTDYIDLFLIHRPSPLMNADSTASGLKNLVESGKIRFAGVSNFTTGQFNLLASRLDFPLVTNQVEFSLIHTDPIYDGTFDQLQKMRARPMTWSPFGGGDLFRDEKNERIQRVKKTLEKLSQKYNADTDTIALAWVLKLPSKPFPVLGTGKAERVQSAVKALDLELELQDWYELLEASRGEPVP